MNAVLLVIVFFFGIGIGYILNHKIEKWIKKITKKITKR